jgi:hypothetical protein
MADGGGLMVSLDVAEYTGAVQRLLTDKKLYAQKLEEAKRQALAWSIQAKAKVLLGRYEKLAADFKTTR